jgi:hypothetical protein
MRLWSLKTKTKSYACSDQTTTLKEEEKNHKNNKNNYLQKKYF